MHGWCEMWAGETSSRGSETDAAYLLNQPFVLGPDVQNVRPPVSFLICRKQSFTSELPLVNFRDRTSTPQSSTVQVQIGGDLAKKSERIFSRQDKDSQALQCLNSHTEQENIYTRTCNTLRSGCFFSIKLKDSKKFIQRLPRALFPKIVVLIHFRVKIQTIIASHDSFKNAYFQECLFSFWLTINSGRKYWGFQM